MAQTFAVTQIENISAPIVVIAQIVWFAQVRNVSVPRRSESVAVP
jgi:hypothetical protein